MGERSLVLFTLLAQAACGALIGLAGVHLIGPTDVLGVPAFVTVGALLLIAAAISTLHLGAPLHAPYAILNVRSSWLSREILGSLLCIALVAAGALVAFLADAASSRSLRTAIGVLAAAAGVLLVVAMARLYALRTVPGWQPRRTAVAFAGTTLRLGALLAGIVASVETPNATSLDRAALWLLLMLVGGAALWAGIGNRHLQPQGPSVHAGALLVHGETPGVLLASQHAARWIAVGTAVGLVGMIALLAAPALLATVILIAGLTLLVPGELDARERFYAAAPRYGRDVRGPSPPRRAASRAD